MASKLLHLHPLPPHAPTYTYLTKYSVLEWKFFLESFQNFCPSDISIFRIFATDTWPFVIFNFDSTWGVVRAVPRWSWAHWISTGTQSFLMVQVWASLFCCSTFAQPIDCFLEFGQANICMLDALTFGHGFPTEVRITETLVHLQSFFQKRNTRRREFSQWSIFAIPFDVACCLVHKPNCNTLFNFLGRGGCCSQWSKSESKQWKPSWWISWKSKSRASARRRANRRQSSTPSKRRNVTLPTWWPKPKKFVVCAH